jgi:guanylate kinase
MIVILGASCSGKTTFINNLKKRPELSKFKFATEYTTRPMRLGEKGDEYRFVTMADYNELKQSGEIIAEFPVVMADSGLNYYGISKYDITSDTIIATNPTAFYQLIMKARFVPIWGIYLDVSTHTRMIRMLQRGDDIHESYRRVVHDSGHYSGIMNIGKSIVRIDADNGISDDAMNIIVRDINKQIC